MAVVVLVIEATAAIPIVELSVFKAPGPASEGEPSVLDSLQDRVEFGVAYVKRIVLACDSPLRVSEVQRQSHRRKVTACHIAKIGVRATVLAPGNFMENLHFGKQQLAKGIYASPLPPTRQLAQVAVADIGAVAVRLLEDPGRFAGKRFDLGSDELTGNDVLAILSRLTGRLLTYFQVPMDVIRERMGEDGAKMYEWFDRVGFTVDRAAPP